MSTLGQKPATQHVSLQKQTITGNGGTSYTLQQSVGSALDIAVFINNTRQEPTTAYSASGTTLTMTGAVNASDHFYVIFLGKAITTTGLPVDAVATANINASAITNAKIANSTIDLTSKVTGVLPTARGGTGDALGSAMVKLLDVSISNVAEYIIDSTHINSTYDHYRLYITLRPATDGAECISRLYVDTSASGSGSLPGGNIYGYENAAMSSSTYNNNNTSSYGVVSITTIGNAGGEGIGMALDLLNVNDTTINGGIVGKAYTYNSSGLHGASDMAWAMALPGTYGSYYIRGFQILFGSGNIANGTVKLYGIK